MVPGILEQTPRLAFVPIALHPASHSTQERAGPGPLGFCGWEKQDEETIPEVPQLGGLKFHMGRALPASWHWDVSRRECPWLLSCSVSSYNPSWATCLAKSPSAHSWLPLQAWTQVQEGAGFQEEGAKALWTIQGCCWPIGMGFQTNTLSQPSCLPQTQR